ncbi:retrovirus-related pol polyprotein from transposon TNT 1-94 [Tanacetum coccineum]
MSINHEKYTLVIVDEYSRMVENQNHVKVKQIRTDNGTEFKNHEFESFCDEKGISHNFSSPYTPKQNGVLKGENRLSLSFQSFNTRRQQVEETYHVTFDKNSDISYYVNPYGRSLSELTQEIHVPEVIAPNEPDIPLTKDTEVPDVPQSHISNQASISSHTVPQNRWSKDQQIKLMNIIDDPGKCMHIVSMAAKLIAASATGCLFADFLSEIEPKKFHSENTMFPPNNLGPDLAGKAVNETSYRGMIGSLIYLTITMPDIQFSTVLCARYQSNQKESHRTAVKKILMYLKDLDYAGCNMDRKSTLGACQILSGKLVCWSAKKQQLVAMSSAEAEYVAAAGCCASIL